MSVRNTQTTIEILRNGTPSVRNTQTTIEILRNGTPRVMNTQIVIEVLRENRSAPLVKSRGGLAGGN